MLRGHDKIFLCLDILGTKINEYEVVAQAEEAAKMSKLDMRTGSTAVLILRLLVDEPMYGYQMVKELQTRSDGYFEMEQGTLYPALHRLEKDGLVQSEWQVVADGPSRKYYSITDAGQAALAEGAAQWRDFSQGLLKILGHSG
jgi:DNA-binding PadR family transcriptional regulator